MLQWMAKKRYDQYTYTLIRNPLSLLNGMTHSHRHRHRDASEVNASHKLHWDKVQCTRQMAAISHNNFVIRCALFVLQNYTRWQIIRNAIGKRLPSGQQQASHAQGTYWFSIAQTCNERARIQLRTHTDITFNGADFLLLQISRSSKLFG